MVDLGSSILHPLLSVALYAKWLQVCCVAEEDAS